MAKFGRLDPATQESPDSPDSPPDTPAINHHPLVVVDHHSHDEVAADEGWTVQRSRRRRKSDSDSLSPHHRRDPRRISPERSPRVGIEPERPAGTKSPTPATYFLKNLPEKTTNKTLSLQIREHIRDYSGTLNVFRDGRTAKLTADKQYDVNYLQRTLRQFLPTNVIVKKKVTRPIAGPLPKPKPPSFSAVIKDVYFDVDKDDVISELKLQGLEISAAWRIKSRKTGRFGPMFRVISLNQKHIDFMLENGVHIFLSHHKVEPSNPPKPQPIQCQRCQQFNHHTKDCSATPKCSRCGGNHHLTECTSDDRSTPSCANCGGPHSAKSFKCKERPPTALNERLQAPLQLADTSQGEVINIEDFLKVMTFSLTNLFQGRKEEVIQFDKWPSASSTRTSYTTKLDNK
ncbi:uncharacterized protein LOC126204319 [Schistocerca nitens]|uniref:uncharacterized protein LOC126204319 n=1 Tax=Schistocerca nitens TaxID=7011 RepID=UPI0021197797|nr:uncharacterized protein LOC126204319 [Schistocerca nitens]